MRGMVFVGATGLKGRALGGWVCEAEDSRVYYRRSEGSDCSFVGEHVGNRGSASTGTRSSRGRRIDIRSVPNLRDVGGYAGVNTASPYGDLAWITVNIQAGC
jgi:hypothetical protein